MLKVCAGLVLVVAGVGVLGGCGGDAAGTSEPPSTTAMAPSSTSAPPSSTSAPPARSASSTASLGPGAPGVPANARANTEAAAIAFVKHFKKTYDQLQVSPKAGVVPTMSLPSCKTCDFYEQTMIGLVQKKQHFDQPGIIPKRFERSPLSDDMWIAMWGDNQGGNIVDTRGNIVEPVEDKRLKNLAMVYQLEWTANGWRIAKIQVDTARATPWN